MSLYLGTTLIANTGSDKIFKPGMLMPYAGSTAPTGWLLCDGSAVSRTTYSDLFSVIGTTYGTGDGSTTFNLPNFVDKTFWGGSTSGTLKSAGLPNITGKISSITYNGANVSEGCFATDSTGSATPGSGSAGRLYSLDASRSSAIYGNSSTVQPPAIQTLVIIKY